jgi:FkbM family methyltransferase
VTVENEAVGSHPGASLATKLRPIAVSVIRALPKVRGRGRLAQAVNSVLLAAGAEPKAVGRMIPGHSLILDTRIPGHCWALYLGNYNEEFIGPLLEFLRPGGVALDVGANIGLVTVPLTLAAKQKGGRVIAFEPFRRNVELIRENLRLNRVEDFVTIIEAGLSSTPHDAELLLREDFELGAETGNASVAEDGIDERFQRVAIRLETLDGLMPTLGNPRVDVIKVDIEGHEDRFLEGATKTLAAFRPVILMEVNRWFYERRSLDFDRLIPSLLPSGYRILSPSLIEIKDLASWKGTDVLFVPDEKLGQSLA